MQWIVEEKDGKRTILPTKVIEPEKIKTALSPLAWKIMKLLSEEDYYPKGLAKKLKMHEQKIYYHIRNLEKAGLVKVKREEARQGAITKYYTITEPSLAVSLRPMEPATKLFSIKQEYRNFLDPFIHDGKFNAKIIASSPEPHGPTKERGKDSIYATNVALFFGTFLNYIPEESVIIFDTDATEEDLKNNLIIIGGPGVNNITKKINKKLPVRFEKVKYKENWYNSIYSDISKKRYSEDTFGLIVKTNNPFDKTKHILVLAGIRHKGTRAASIALLQNFKEIIKGNSYDKRFEANVIDGIDADSDGIIDTTEIIE